MLNLFIATDYVHIILDNFEESQKQINGLVSDEKLITSEDRCIWIDI